MSHKTRRSARTTALLAEQRAATRRYTALLDQYDREGRVSLVELAQTRERTEALVDGVGTAMFADIENNPHKASRNECVRRLRHQMSYCNELLSALNRRYDAIMNKEIGTPYVSSLAV